MLLYFADGLIFCWFAGSPSVSLPLSVHGISFALLSSSHLAPFCVLLGIALAKRVLTRCHPSTASVTVSPQFPFLSPNSSTLPPSLSDEVVPFFSSTLFVCCQRVDIRLIEFHLTDVTRYVTGRYW